ncbi:glycosyltransferase [Arsenophonus nasoniae]|uniref:Glycosyltransferase n=1 Tax=Arsenophonus nasoniae TaxID=638 RepID=A0AA95GSH2_9GAMM|nr:glycosyltransferase [Arsenophonus nasoniae]WGL95353.1 glycosyltransferase [Arsenophonus nasoniae]WGM02104.1 glycosyltransferase [Arsenophonus nasoniae]
MLYNFSVLISVYSKENPLFFDLALDSIYRQTFLPNEIIVVQDGKLTQQLYDIINKWKTLLPIKDVILQENQGLGIALNRGLNACTNDLVMRVDSDDINHTDRFEKQYNYMNKNLDITMCGSHIAEFDNEPTNIIGFRFVPIGKEISSVINKRNPFNHMTVCFRKKHILAVGGYQDLKFMEDYYLWIRLYAQGYKLENINEILVDARTGIKMIKRRKGILYLKSEIIMLKYLLKFKIGKNFSTISIFTLRAIFRLMPSYLLSKFYMILRK